MDLTHSSTDQRLERIEFTSYSLETRVDDLASATASINTFTGSVFALVHLHK